MSGGRPAVYINRPIVENATRRAGQRLPLRRDLRTLVYAAMTESFG